MAGEGNSEGEQEGAAVQPLAAEQVALQQRALGQLARREHSRRELERKLARAGASAELIRQVLDDLAERGLQSDARFAEALVSNRVRRGQGVARVRRELADRGVAAEVIDATCAGGGIDWQRRAREVCREKFGTGVPADRKEWARRARFLSYRGFATEIICAVLASTTDGEDS